MYHGVSLDEVIAELPEEKASYDDPHKAMYHLLKEAPRRPRSSAATPGSHPKKGLPHYGGGSRHFPHRSRSQTRLREVPQRARDQLRLLAGQTDFQKSVNIEPDAGFAPIVDLDTLDVTVQKFS